MKTPEEVAARKIYRDLQRMLRPTGAVVFIATCVLIAAIYFARQALIPVALAMLLATVLSSAVEVLHRWKIPRSVAAAAVLLAILCACGFVLNAVTEPAEQWFSSLPRTLQILERKIRPIEQVLKRVELVSSRATAIAAASSSNVRAAPSAVNAGPAAVSAVDVLMWTRSGLINTITVLILTLFLLSGGPPMLARMATAVGNDLQATGVVRVIEAIRNEVSRYYATIAMINLGLGIATGLAMTALGMPNPVLWGTMAAVFNFVPYVGSAITLLVLTTVAVVTFNSIGEVIAVIVSYLGLATVEGQIVQPLLVGHRLEISPLMVFLAVWFGGWLWGIAGIVIAVPLLVVIKVAAENSPEGQSIVAFLSPGPSSRLKPVVLLGSLARKSKSDELAAQADHFRITK